MLNYSENSQQKESVIPEWFQKEDVDCSLLNELIDENTELGPDNILKNSKYNPLLTPFDLKWMFGFDVSVPVLNLSGEDRREIFYAATNIGILYDYCSKKMVQLKGHQSKIVSVSIDRTGRWLATADNGSENVIMIWDTSKSNYSVVWTIFNQPSGGYDLLLVGLSPNAKLLITVSNKDGLTIDFWLWTYGKEEPDDSYSDERSLGAPKAIEFHPNKEEHFMIVFENAVLLFCWDHDKKKLAKTTSPKCPLISSIGHYTDGTYVNRCQECFVSSTKGCILVFGNTIFARNFVPEEIDNDKFYIKSIKTNKGPINCITSVDELIVTGDSAGTIMFFDKRVKLLFWFARQLTKSIKSISFQLNPRKYKLVSLEEYNKLEEEEYEENYDETEEVEDDSSEKIPACFVDRSKEYELLVLEKVPRDAALERRPFLTRDFFITTADGTIYYMNFAKQNFIPLFPTAGSHVAAIDVHEDKPYIVIAYAKGQLVIYNYETFEEVITASLPETDNDAVITTIKYSRQCIHLACGRSNGELWLLQPIVLSQIYVDPFKFGEDRVMKIAFSKSSLQMAYYDSNMTVYAFHYDMESDDWIFKGKVRSHYKEICNMLFLDEPPFGLYTVGKDRNLVKYTNIGGTEEELDIITRDRIEQKDIPVYFTSYPRRKFSKGGYFLVADDKHKYKIVSTRTSMCTSVYLGPAYGCFREGHVRKMEFLPKSDKKYIIFITKKQIGIQLMPIDGNPFKYVGCLGHPEELVDFQMSNDGHYIFTIGKNDRTVFMWKVKPSSVETMHILGGVELQPFYCLIEGGRSGFLFQEMRDLFYYMQILQQGEQICAPRIVSNCINLGELPDLMRACGYYPSEYEIENLLTDLRYKDFDDTSVLKDKVSFCEFVKLFINHKPAYGYSIEGLEEAFEAVTTFADEYGGSDMSRDDFIEAVTTTGEQVSIEQIFKCLVRLLHAEPTHDDSGERDFSFMPDTVDFDYLTEDILGLDMDTVERADNAGGGDDEDDDRPYYYYR